MKILQGSGQHEGTEHFVLRNLTDEPVKIEFYTQIDDLLIASPDGDILIAWDTNEWNDDKCLLIQKKDNLKELNNLRCTKLLVKAGSPEVKTCYITIQRN